MGRAREMYSGLGADFAYRPAEIKFPSGAIFKTGHLKDENAYGKYLGHEYQKMVIEELTQIPTEESYMKLISSCRSTVEGLEPQVFMTTNPGGPGHGWVKQRFIEVGEWGEPYLDPTSGRTRIFIRSKLEDNPTLMKMDPTYLTFLDSLPDNLRRAWRDGSWDIIAGQVFTEWRRELHVIDEFPIAPEWNKWISLDWGVNAPFCVLWWAEGFDRRIYCVKELYMNGMEFEKRLGYPLTPTRLARTINALNSRMGFNDYQFMVADPSIWNHPEGGESIAETMMKEGMKLIEADNERVNGLARVREYLATAPDGKPYMQVFKCCTNLIRTLPALSYDERKMEDIDTDLEDHCLVGETLVLTNKGWVEIQKLENAKVTGYDTSILEIVTDTGESLKCTPNHKILTTTGWVEAQELKNGSEILWWSARRYKNTGVSDTTFADFTSSTWVKGYTELFGQIGLAKFQLATTSTTRTGIEQTTVSKTSTSLDHSNTLAIIPAIQQRDRGKLGEKMPLDPVGKVIRECLRNSDVKRVYSVVSAGKRDMVYDVGIEHEFHGFIVNGGFIVHNCYDSVRYMLMSRPARVNQVENPITDSILYDYKKKTGQLKEDGEVLFEM